MSPCRTAIPEWTAIPWRLRTGIETWIESSAREQLPPLCRLQRFGRVADPVRPVTRGPRQHFFGHHDKSPRNASEGLPLTHEVEFNDRPPELNDPVTAGVPHLQDGNRFVPLASSLAWNRQQGCVPQWRPADPEDLLVHNGCRGKHFFTVVRDAVGRERRVHGALLSALSSDGRTGYSLNLAYLHRHRPGDGAAGVTDEFEPDGSRQICVVDVFWLPT